MRPRNHSQVDPLPRLRRYRQKDNGATRHAPLLRLQEMETRLSLLPRRRQPQPPLPQLAVQNLRQPIKTPLPLAPTCGMKDLGERGLIRWKRPPDPPPGQVFPWRRFSRPDRAEPNLAGLKPRPRADGYRAPVLRQSALVSATCTMTVVRVESENLAVCGVFFVRRIRDSDPPANR